MSTTEGAIPDRAVADWAPEERESFFRAIHRHRRAAWRVSVVSALANCIVAFVVAVMMAPLFYAALCLTFDLVNLAIPMPNLVTAIGALYKVSAAHDGHVYPGRWLMFMIGVATPGLLWMAMVIRMLSRVLKTASAAAGVHMRVRAANRQVLAEQRFVNVIEEMSIAAGLPVPNILVTQCEMLNAAVFGLSERDATIIVSETLLATLERQEMQGVSANLVASIADGDVTIGQRIAVTISLFGLIALFSSLMTQDDGLQKLWRLLGMLVRPSKVNAETLIVQISDPPAERRKSRRNPVGATAGPDPKPKKESNWRLWFLVPFWGPVGMTGLFTGFVSDFVLRPLVGLTWRKRKYMADAVAVKLTRDPDALASALERMGSGESFAVWMAHLSVVTENKRGALLGGSIVPMFPSLQRRLRALQKLGSSVIPPASKPVNWGLVILASPLMVLMVLLLVLVILMLSYIPFMMSALFTGVPFAVLHLLLRWVGH